MNRIEKQTFIHQKAIENQNNPNGEKIYWSRHAIVELVKDGLARTDIEAALITCEIIEDYPTAHRPLPDCLVLGTLTQDQPVHAVIAIDKTQDRLFVITVYLPSEERWENDWRTRKGE